MPLAEIVIALVAALVGASVPLLREMTEQLLKSSVLARSLLGSTAGKAYLRLIGVTGKPTVTDSKRLFAQLSKASGEIDAVMGQIEDLAAVRRSAVTKIEADLDLLARQERELKEKVEGLKNVPLPAAEYFATLVGKNEKRGALRDYILFLLGVIVSAAVAVVLKHFGLA